MGEYVYLRHLSSSPYMYSPTFSMLLNDPYDSPSNPLVCITAPSPRPTLDEDTDDDYSPRALVPHPALDVIVLCGTKSCWLAPFERLLQHPLLLAGMVLDPYQGDYGVLFIPEEDDFVVEAILRWTNCLGLSPRRHAVPDPRVRLSKLLKAAYRYNIIDAVPSLRAELDYQFIRQYPIAAMSLAITYGFEREARVAQVAAYWEDLPTSSSGGEHTSTAIDRELWQSVPLVRQLVVRAVRRLRAEAIVGLMDEFIDRILFWPCHECDGDFDTGGEMKKTWPPHGWRVWRERGAKEVLHRPVVSPLCTRDFLADCMEESGCTGCIEALEMPNTTSMQHVGDRLVDVVIHGFWGLHAELPHGP
ncbi:hypothetical protein EXIGLDRAFT_735854 [Exidia glandulosa HHB12029]|uniref:BTB domain-containing protein n=1 Tax=Exidia glandulosa HHB12029 TaxID=1314781 RepID=A0A166NEH4_EXIGL|nr:hypothetical protein EXIGLDRAFT_735854 [Exidia glandulosa HHB12029]